MDAPSVQNFNNIDKNKIRQIIRSKLDPTINYDYRMHYIENKCFGIFYIEELRNKPAVCKCDASDSGVFSIGDIFYRNNEEVVKIQYSDLQNILEEKRINEQNKWMNLLTKIASIGANNLLIIDLKDNIIFDTNDTKINIDKTIINKLNYIKEGEFNELTGAPTIKLVGNVLINDEVQQEEDKNIVLLERDIIIKYLKEDFTTDPFMCIKSFVSMQGNMPIYGYINKLNKDTFVNGFIEIEKELRTKANYKRIIKNLSEGKSYFLELIEFKTDVQKRRRKYREMFLKLDEKNLFVIDESVIEKSLDSINTIEKFGIRKIKDFLFKYLNSVFSIVYDKPFLFNKFRNAILWIDEALYLDIVTQHTRCITFN